MNNHENDVMVPLGNFIQSLLPDVPIVMGLINLVAAPVGPYIRMTPAGMRRLRTNQDSYDLVDTRTVERSEEYAIQIDFYGPDSAEWASTIETMFRDFYACDMLAPTCQPLHAEGPIQSPLSNGEENYEQRWILTALIQYNPTVTLPQQYADTLDVTLISVDATFKP